MTKYISHEDFVVAWTTSSSADEVANTLAVLKVSCVARATHLRKLGVKLKIMPQRAPLDAFRIAQLNSLIIKHSKEK